jgi:hypothetical protein
MTIENRRKEEYEAKTEDSRRNLVQPTNSAMVDKAKQEESILPDNQRYIHIPKIEGVINDYITYKRHEKWKKPRIRLKKIALGIKEKIARKHAYSSKGPWRMVRSYCMHKGLSNSVIVSMGYTR